MVYMANIEINPTTKCLYRASWAIPEKHVRELNNEEMVNSMAKREVILNLAEKIAENHKVKSVFTPEFNHHEFSLDLYVFSREEIKQFIKEVQERTREEEKRRKGCL